MILLRLSSLRRFVYGANIPERQALFQTGWFTVRKQSQLAQHREYRMTPLSACARHVVQ